ncbi:MAG: cation transporter [Chloroflexi bacterium]|nr:MAG: cation transporter [Chloroflexota bacterium]
MNIELRDQKSIFAINMGLVANVILSIVKTTVGIIGHSPALLAEGINSTSDVVYNVVASIYVRMAQKPADREHPYGHRQLESIASLVVGSFVITTGVAVFWDSINTVFELFTGETTFQGGSRLALWIAILTVIIKIFLFFYTRNTGKLTKNALVTAIAYDHRNDIFSASAAGIGIFLGQQGYPWVDPLAGALVAILIFKTGIEILREASIDLMDAVPSEQIASEVIQLLEDVEGIDMVEEIHAHRFGPYLVINVTIGIDGTLTVAEGDHISCQVEDRIQENLPFVRRVHVHYHPHIPVVERIVVRSR